MASRTRGSVRYRCNKCGTRFRWRKTRKTEPKCTWCRSTNVWNEEASRRKELANQERCHCNWYPFPHRKGSMTMCIHHPDRVAGIVPTDDEIRDYEGCLATPRSGFC